MHTYIYLYIYMYIHICVCGYIHTCAYVLMCIGAIRREVRERIRRDGLERRTHVPHIHIFIYVCG